MLTTIGWSGGRKVECSSPPWMLVVFVWTLRPAWRTVWGAGVIFVCINALVDYPFARLAVCGWYFALVGMLGWASRRKGFATSPSQAA